MKTAITHSELIELVKTEAANLLIHATKGERMRLNFKSLIPSRAEKCIYGQMAGNCTSYRACELIIKCATKVIDNDGGKLRPMKKSALRRERAIGLARYIEHFSPIEWFIIDPKSIDDSRILIEYLREERTDLNFQQ